MTRKVYLSLQKLGERIHNHVYSPKGDITGNISVETGRYIPGMGYPARRLYDFPFWVSKEDCTYDDGEELKSRGLSDALSGLRAVVFPAVVEETSRQANTCRVRVRRAIIGKDILKD